MPPVVTNTRAKSIDPAMIDQTNAPCPPTPLHPPAQPTNHLDAESVAWLEDFLREFQGTVVAITHDRYFLDNVAGWILELDRGVRPGLLL